jgi:hypothetical protein
MDTPVDGFGVVSIYHIQYCYEHFLYMSGAHIKEFLRVLVFIVAPGTRVA